MMLHCLLLLSTVVGESFQDGITSGTNAVHALEGSSVTLSCNYTSSNIMQSSLQWYRQYPSSKPEFLILVFGSKDREVKDKFTVEHKKAKNHVHLVISSAKVTDSALYYCALRPAGGGVGKLIFGKGTKLLISTGTPSSPQYYKLKDKDNVVSACLATDFSEYNATDEKDLFKRTKINPTRIHGDSYFDKVVVLSKNINECPAENETETDVCDSGAGGIFETDEKINFLSLTILGLRILFLKSIVFNVLMTLRAWMS